MIRVTQECSIEATARLCNLRRGPCWNTLERAVGRGRRRKVHRVPGRIGLDEKSTARGHKYESLVYEMDAGTIEYVCDDRGQDSLEDYFRQFSKDEPAKVKAVAIDMWDP